MHKNIFLKSALRQPIRSLLLALLIGVAAFAFVARAVEYRVVTGEIARIEGFYHSVGFLQHPDFVPSPRRFQQIMPAYNDVNTAQAAEIISQSRYLAFDDSRRFIQGELTDGKTNANFNTYGAPILGVRGIHYVYFYGTFDSRPGGGTDRLRGKYRHIIIDVDYVVSGFPEHIYEGEEVRIVYFGAEEEHLRGERPAWTDVTTPFDNLIPGERYFFKASLRWWMIRQDPPHTGRLDPHTFVVGGDEVWYIHAPDGELDFSDPALVSLGNEIETSIINQRTMHVIGTTDMSDMPVFHPDAQTYILQTGRFIDHDDYLNANPVAVIGHGFAEYHGLEIGDTITLTLRDMQSPVIPYGYYDWQEIPTQEAEFTIVGTHDKHFRFRLLVDVGDTGHVTETGFVLAFLTSFTNPHVYVPLSTIPDGFGGDVLDYGLRDYSFVLTSARYERDFIAENSDALGALGFEMVFFEHGGERFFDSADPIILSVTINLIVFSLLSLLVLCLASFMFLYQGRQNFAIMRALGMPSATLLAQNIMVTVLFWLPAIVIGSILAWNFALNQAQSALAGLVEFERYVNGYYIEPDSSIEIYAELFAVPSLHLPILCATFALVVFVLVFVGGVRTVRRPVLELLQGKRTRSHKTSRKSLLVLLQGLNTKDEGSDTSGAHSSQSVELQSLQLSQIIVSRDGSERSAGGTKLKTFSGSGMLFVWRHIVRVPIKSILTVFSAMFFVAALIWLQVTIDRTAEEIEVLYDTMPITAEIEAVEMLYPFFSGEMITKDIMDAILNDEFVRDAYILSEFSLVNLIDSQGIDDHIDAVQDLGMRLWDIDWSRPVGYDELGLHHVFENHVAPSCLETFFAESHLSYAMVWGGEPFAYSFVEGFDVSSFYYDDSTLTEPIPVIVHEDILEFRELILGGTAYMSMDLGFLFVGSWHQFLGMSFSQYPVQIIGSYSGYTIGSFLHHGDGPHVIMPLDALRFIRGDAMTYAMARVEIDPARNHELAVFEDRIGEIIEQNNIQVNEFARQDFPLRLTINDDEFRQVVIPMEQNLELLQILYPIAIVASVILGMGLSLMLMLQHTKNAAAMRVLGSTKGHIRALMCVELLIVTLTGIALTLILMPMLGMGFAIVFLQLAGLYLGSVIVGGVVGAIIVSRRAPLELLQVRE